MMNLYQWLSEGVEAPSLDLSLTQRWIAAVAASHGFRVGSLTYIFCSDHRIIEVNRQFLHHDYYTDIITFDDTLGHLLRGDIYISLDTVRSNALSLGVPYERELMRVIIHGVLHLCGINDKGPGEREIMERNEDAALAMLDDMRCSK